VLHRAAKETFRGLKRVVSLKKPADSQNLNGGVGTGLPEKQ